jgi:hypothetical protein
MEIADIKTSRSSKAYTDITVIKSTVDSTYIKVMKQLSPSHTYSCQGRHSIMVIVDMTCVKTIMGTADITTSMVGSGTNSSGCTTLVFLIRILLRIPSRIGVGYSKCNHAGDSE